MKYVILEDLFPRICTEAESHANLAGLQAHKVTSAGFCRISDDGIVSAWGESVGLKIKSKPTDAETIAKALKN